MNIYVFGKKEQLTQIRYLQAELRQAGHFITFDWTVVVGYFQLSKDVITAEIDRNNAVCDIEGIKVADCVVGYVPDKLPFRGAYVELGAAIALGKPVLLIGHGMDECVFVHHPLVKIFDKMSEVIEFIKTEDITHGNRMVL